MSQKVKRLLQGCQDNYIFPFFWQHGEEEAVLRDYMQKFIIGYQLVIGQMFHGYIQKF